MQIVPLYERHLIRQSLREIWLWTQAQQITIQNGTMFMRGVQKFTSCNTHVWPYAHLGITLRN